MIFKELVKIIIYTLYYIVILKLEDVIKSVCKS